MTNLGSLLLALALTTALPASGGVPVASACTETRARTWRPAAGVADREGDVRVYAIQYKQEVRHVASYATFRRKMFCLIEEMVLPTADRNGDRRADNPTIVAFNEDTGFATIATGSRGAVARSVAAYGPKDPDGLSGAQAAFASFAAAYEPAISYYAARHPDTSPQRLILAAATDTFARGFMKVNSDLARTFGIYVVSGNTQAEFRETSDAAAIAALGDPDLAHKYATGELRTVYQAVDVPGEGGAGRAGIDVYNQVWMWAPDDGVTEFARRRYAGASGRLPSEDPRANVIAATRKTPLTQLERNVLDLSDDGDMSAENTGPFALLPRDDPRGKVKIGFGISLPAFMWGSEFGTPIAAEPCARNTLWMRCLDARGVTLFLQPEANPGMWAEYIDRGWNPPAFQALSWLDSAWRAVADPTVRNIRYAVTPHMVGNLVDVTFDGQSAIFERCIPRPSSDSCGANEPATFVGARRFVACSDEANRRCDDPRLEPYAGLKREAVVLAPWVRDDCDVCASPGATRELLAARSRAMQAGSGSPFENDYLETTIWADLDFD